ncbi:MAG: hypothetical protein KC493_06840 [Bacteriovoracaceae bacterium]|nr:hypothetical protein [Bacteriovoracaceae bacterium]
MQNLNKLVRYLTILCSLILVSSCGLGDNAEESLEVFDLGQLEGTCEFDTEKLGKILDEQIDGEIDCLESNLSKFVDFVRREDPRFIARSELQRFIDKFFPANKNTQVKELLKLVFDLNTVLLKDPTDKISVGNMKLLFQLFRVVNHEGRLLNGLITGMDEFSYWDRRQSIFTLTAALSEKVLNIIQQRPVNESSNLQIKNFLSELKVILEIGEADLDIELIDNFLFVKKLILGGERNVIDSAQFEKLFSMIPNLLVLGMDAMMSGGKKFFSDGDKWFFYMDVVREFRTYFYPFEQETEILSHTDLSNVSGRILGNKYSMENMEDSIKNIKTRIIGGTADSYTFKNVETLLTWGQGIFEQFYFNEVTYEHFRSVLDGPGAVTDLQRPDLEEYQTFHKKRVPQLWNKFDELTSTHRFFQDKNGWVIFDDTYKRSSSGYTILTLFNWGLNKLIKAYGAPRENGWSISIDDMRVLIYEIEGLLREMDFWQADVERFLSESVNSSDNFQFNANGDMVANIHEASEYFTTVFTSVDITKDVHAKLKNYCDVVDEEDKSFEIECYRENFYKVFFEEMHMEKYYPKLKVFLDSIGPEKALQHLVNMETYSRIIPDPSLPMTQTDLGRVIIGFGNVESSILKFDQNRSGGVLERPELDMAFPVFKNLIIQVAQLKPATQFLAKSIFLYLVKEMKEPSTLKLLTFHFFGKKKDIVCDRFRLASILSFFVETP